MGELTPVQRLNYENKCENDLYYSEYKTDYVDSDFNVHGILIEKEGVIMSRVLVACEESQAVTIEFRKLGIEAYSCDTQECSGGHPEWHLKQDVIPLLQEHWDLVIAFPPCTHLAVCGVRWFPEKRKDGRQQKGIDFFMKFTKIKVPRVCIENPIGIMSGLYRKPDQIIQPYYFGDTFQKTTCLWLKGLNELKYTDIVDRGEMYDIEKEICIDTLFGKWNFIEKNTMPKWYAEAWKMSAEQRAVFRSKTFPGIAKAMAEQWGAELQKPFNNRLEFL